MSSRKRVQSPSRHVHVVGTPGKIKPRQLPLQSRRVVRLDAGLAPHECAVFVRSGATLTIEPGTVIFGDTASKGALVIAQGGKVNSAGTADNPVIMTSPAPLGERQPQDWGGVIINGYAPLNVPGGTSSGEGDTGTYGGGATPFSVLAPGADEQAAVVGLGVNIKVTEQFRAGLHWRSEFRDSSPHAHLLSLGGSMAF